MTKVSKPIIVSVFAGTVEVKMPNGTLITAYGAYKKGHPKFDIVEEKKSYITSYYLTKDGRRTGLAFYKMKGKPWRVGISPVLH